METSATPARELIRLAWPVLIAQLALMANAVIDTAMAGRLSAVDLAAVGIAASIMGTVLMSLISVLLALPPIIAHLYGAGNRAAIGREIHQGVWISLVLALAAILLLRFPNRSLRSPRCSRRWKPRCAPTWTHRPGACPPPSRCACSLAYP